MYYERIIDQYLSEWATRGILRNGNSCVLLVARATKGRAGNGYLAIHQLHLNTPV